MKRFIILVCSVLVVFSVLGCRAVAKIEADMNVIKAKGELEAQESLRRVTIEQAKADLESSKMYAQVEVERAKGVAEANKIIGESLKDNESYLRYLWIQGLQDGSSEVIYIPTEANLPLLEARERK